MDWNELLNEKLLAGQGEELLKTWLVAQIPEFRAPTDPQAWPKKAGELRRRALREVYLRGIPASVIKAKPRVIWREVLRPADDYVIRKLCYEAYPNYWVPALLYEPRRLAGRMPVVLNPNGHHHAGKPILHKQARCINQARRGVIALSPEFIGMGELYADCLHNQVISQLNLTGLSGVGIFYLAMRKGLDVLLAHKHADPARVGVTGLSGGGWQTIVLAALDERVTMAAPVAGFTSVRARVNELADIGDLEQTPPDLTTVLDYQDLVAMLAPRPALLICNEKDDCCFATARTKPVIYDAVAPTYRAFGAEQKFRFHNNLVPGTHNYDEDNRSQFYRFLHDHWGVPGPFHDLHQPAELLSDEALAVGLPNGHQTLAEIAMARARRLAKQHRPPATPAQRAELRRRLIDTIRLPAYAAPEPAAPVAGLGSRILRVGSWSVPISWRLESPAKPVELVISGAGRAQSQLARKESDASRFAADLLGFGENRAEPRYHMLVDTVGRRLLGEQVAQVLACARFAAAGAGGQRIRLVSEGAFTSLACLVAAAIEPARFESLAVNENLTTLLQLLHWNIFYETCQGAMCFGLLEVADIPQILRLLENVRYEQPGRLVLPMSFAATK